MVNFIGGCAPGIFKEKKGYVKLSPSEELRVVKQLDLNSQNVDSWEELQKPLKRSLEYLDSKAQDKYAFDKYGLLLSWGELRHTLDKLLQILPKLDDHPELLAKEFEWYQLKPDPWFTGYFEPRIEASLESKQGYNCPIYGQPEDLKTARLGKFHPRWQGETLVYRIQNGTIHPYYSRKKIKSKNVLKGKAPIIAWAKDPLDVFYLQIQGSGRLLLPDGSKQFIGYAGKNGREYVSIGRILVQEGFLNWEELSMQSIREFLKENPEIKPRILNKNPSFVFFQLRKDGLYGSMGQKLTPLVSVAVDYEILPLGSVLALNLDLPARESRDRKLKGLGLAQDRGGAIDGHHLDLFCGSGKRASYTAGHLKEHGQAYFMIAD